MIIMIVIYLYIWDMIMTQYSSSVVVIYYVARRDWIFNHNKPQRFNVDLHTIMVQLDWTPIGSDRVEWTNRKWAQTFVRFVTNWNTIEKKCPKCIEWMEHSEHNRNYLLSILILFYQLLSKVSKETKIPMFTLNNTKI